MYSLVVVPVSCSSQYTWSPGKYLAQNRCSIVCFELKGWWKGSQKSKGIYKRTKANTSKVSLELGQGEITTGKQKELEKENKEWRETMLNER